MVEDVSVGEVMSVVSQLISLEILGKKSTKEGEGGLSVIEPWPEEEGRVQTTSEVKNLQKMLVTERVQVEKAHKDGAQGMASED